MIKDGSNLYKNFIKRLRVEIKNNKALSQNKQINIVFWGKLQTNIELCEIIKSDKYLSKIISIKAFISSPEYIKAEQVAGL